MATFVPFPLNCRYSHCNPLFSASEAVLRMFSAIASRSALKEATRLSPSSGSPEYPRQRTMTNSASSRGTKSCFAGLRSSAATGFGSDLGFCTPADESVLPERIFSVRVFPQVGQRPAAVYQIPPQHSQRPSASGSIPFFRFPFNFKPPCLVDRSRDTAAESGTGRFSGSTRTPGAYSPGRCVCF